MQQRSRNRQLLYFILIAYLVLAGAYAVKTPKWEVPDEPAHFNYIRHVAENQSFPTLDPGDYPHAYLERLKQLQFPEGSSITPLQYESHQPPLYYVIGAGIYRIAGVIPVERVPGQESRDLLARLAASDELDRRVTALRFLSLAFGLGVVFVSYITVHEIFPADRILPAATAAFVAFLPMQVAITAAINNDALAELILSLLLYLGVRRVKDSISQRRYVLWAGVLLGLGFLTKLSVYIAPIIIISAEASRYARKENVQPREVVLIPLGILNISILLSFWWFLRNLRTYGGNDFLGLQRHDLVVANQPRTSEWLIRFGELEVATRFVTTTFKSFWGTFGWMGILLDERIYLGLAALSASVALGFILYILEILNIRERGRAISREARYSLGLAALTLLLTFVGYLWYNRTFVQFQGRYLFPAIVPIGLFFSLGFREIVSENHEGLFFTLLYLGLYALAAGSLFFFIVPHFSQGGA